MMEEFNDCEIHRNEVFNYNFALPGLSRSFPSGWQPKGRKTSAIVWEADNSIRIHNQSQRVAGIVQQQKYRIPVYREQVWKVVANFRSNQRVTAVVIVYFSNSFTHISRVVFEFEIESKNGYFEELVYIPPGASQVYLEVGLRERGTIWVSEVCFARVFPISQYDTDARGRLNINSVESLRRIQEAVTVKGKITATRLAVDVCEERTADPAGDYSSAHDVSLLSTYSFCVINLGCADLLVYLQVSPDKHHWLDESPGNNHVGANEMKIFVNNYFLRYTRLAFFTAEGTAELKVYFQGQG